MPEALTLQLSQGQSKEMEMEGRTIRYRQWLNLPYCENPSDPIQKLNLFVPEAYMEGETINGFTAETAPIFCPNTVGGYMPGPADEPGVDRFGRMNSIFQALEHGYVVMSAGVRGRTTGRKTDEFFEGSVLKESAVAEKACGKAPAFVVDMKAAIRWLRHNKDAIPGDVEKIIVSGTSAGGALAALTGASGNQPAYAPWLQEIGACQERDDVFAASCYCPIIDLDHADMAYEWQFGSEKNWQRMIKRRTPEGLVRELASGALSEEERQLSKMLKTQYPAYINSLELKDEKGESLLLREDGTGSFQDWIAGKVLDSAKEEQETGKYQRLCPDLVVEGSDPYDRPWLEGKLDWQQYVKATTRMKGVPAFDALDGHSPENEEFGTPEKDRQHFTAFSTAHAKDGRGMAEETIISLMNPLSFAGQEGTAPHWRIRHGSWDRDTSLAVSALLALKLQNNGIEPDFAYPWGLPHSGDYDLPDLFAWIDAAVKGESK